MVIRIFCDQNVIKEILIDMFLNLFCCRDREKFVRLSKEVDELKSEVKKLRRRVRSLEKKKETGDPSKNSTDDEVLDIPHAGPINLSELTSSCKKFTKAPDAVAFLLNSLFSKNEIKILPFLAKELLNAGRRDPALLLTRLDSGFWRELFLKPFQISQGKTCVKKFRTCKKLRESVNYVVQLKRKE